PTLSSPNWPSQITSAAGWETLEIGRGTRSLGHCRRNSLRDASDQALTVNDPNILAIRRGPLVERRQANLGPATTSTVGLDTGASRDAYLRLAEGRGFEPPVGLPLRLISSQVPLTTQPPFRPMQRKYCARISRCGKLIRNRGAVQNSFKLPGVI